MKARPFLAVVLLVAVLLLSLGLAGWWLVWQRSPLQLQRQPLVVPLSARFVPRSAPLALYLLADGNQPVDYARAVAPTSQRRPSAEAVARLRDGAFAAAGIDYSGELAEWLGPEITLALLETGADPGDTGWLLALRSRDDQGARRFLQRFWQTRSLAGTDLQISRYRGMGLISGRGALLGQEPAPLATALIDDDLVLIGSGRGVLEQALDVSQIDELNQAASSRFQQQLQQLERGVVVVQARPEALQRWLGLPASLADDSRVTDLVAALRPQGTALVVDALLGWKEPGLQLDPAEPEGPLNQLRGSSRQLLLLQNPASLLASPLAPALAPLAGSSDEESLPALVATRDAGPLLWSETADGWVLGTAADRPALADLAADLERQGLVMAPLTLASRGTDPVQVWTRLSLADGRGDRQLQASLAGARSQSGAWAWWGQNLAVLDRQQSARGLPHARLEQLTALAMPSAPLQRAMAAAPARDWIEGWQPWRLLSGLAGTRLSEPVQGASFAAQADGEALRLRARLELAG
ncbi:DUF3352 domain-containing protein [Synechococcus sp. CBW1006]|uniref:DUF3352 domain-containing protein n=1 Tax=Synechococcus sp. CBW1006 TaxID=1353138 RepID=UPI0018CF8C48|nr:DUF3352 domain-containing protein [Synechococcus sp. CBW1006]QPN67914.1 DUF3352 domain-containing protein [Synechococcus sp. CBW1006]